MFYICWKLFLIIISRDHRILTMEGCTTTKILKHNIMILTWRKPEMTLWKFCVFKALHGLLNRLFLCAILGIHSLIIKNVYEFVYNKVSCFSRISLWWKPPYGEKNQLMKVHLNPLYPISLLYHLIKLL